MLDFNYENYCGFKVESAFLSTNLSKVNNFKELLSNPTFKTMAERYL